MIYEVLRVLFSKIFNGRLGLSYLYYKNIEDYKMKALIHTCCAPCSIKCIDILRSEGMDLAGYWYNPNIHPFTEYANRKEALVRYAKDIGMELFLREEYGLREFISGVSLDFDRRCGFCYGIRLDDTARYASENGFDGFSTTLLISPYQNHELIRQTAEEAAKKYNVKFLYRDFRPYFREGQNKARELALYMQKYCGCIFSEEERYKAN